MSGNTYSLPHSTGHTNSISLETLDFLTSKLLKRFETFISKILLVWQRPWNDNLLPCLQSRQDFS